MIQSLWDWRTLPPVRFSLASPEVASDTWVAEVKRILGKKQPLTSAGLHALPDEHAWSIKGEGRRQDVDCRNSRRDRPPVANHPAPDAPLAAPLIAAAVGGAGYFTASRQSR